MVATPREVLDEVAPGVRVRYRRSEPPPPYTYAITVEVKEEEVWRTLRLWDNADDVNEHHMHRYTRRGGKQNPEVLRFESINEAMAAAKKKGTEEWAEIMREWLKS